MYDLIGDIHGHADKLKQLLGQLGYENRNGSFRHPDRTVIFLGDYIDRGPAILETLQIVRGMVDAGHALAILGNHEWNALAFHTPDPASPGEYLRGHHEKNVKQHVETMRQLSPRDLASYLDWFRTLPLWLELAGLRAVHACWDDAEIANVNSALLEHGGMTPALLEAGSRKDSAVFKAVETILKGKEISLPNGVVFEDKEGYVRQTIRTRWYLSGTGLTYRQFALQSTDVDSDEIIKGLPDSFALAYPESAKPVFVGHYWLWEERPGLLTNNVACLDYSVAKPGGYLCAYRWRGERTLTDNHFVWTGKSDA